MKLTTIHKRNCIALAKHHKEHCDGDGEGCGVSLILLMEMAIKTGVKFTDKEGEIFL